ncbi:MAG: hypothetical protein ACN6OP_29460 [Pseudomonadales bacterium]
MADFRRSRRGYARRRNPQEPSTLQPRQWRLSNHLEYPAEGCNGALSWMTLARLHRGKASLLDVVSGAIASQVVIAPACGYVGPMGTLAVGLVVWPCCTLAIEMPS